MSEDAVTRAAGRVDEDHFVLASDGSLLPQTTASGRIVELIRWLEVPGGARVLEIGTGSGYSAAVLSEVVGPDGAVVSVDVDGLLVERARDLLDRAGVTNVTVVAADGAHGAPDEAPFDRVIAWATPEVIPASWTGQTRPGAVIVSPVQLSALAHTEGIVRLRVGEDGSVTGDGLIEGGFAPLHPEPVTQWTVPPRRVDAARTDAAGADWWLSAAWLRDPEVGEAGDAMLDALIAGADGRRLGSSVVSAPTPLEPGVGADGEVEDLTGFLLARRPEGLTTACLGDRDWWIGCSGPDGIALLRRRDGTWVAEGSPRVAGTVTDWVLRWRAAGRPGWEPLEATLSRVGGGWRVRAVDGSSGR